MLTVLHTFVDLEPLYETIIYRFTDLDNDSNDFIVHNLRIRYNLQILKLIKK